MTQVFQSGSPKRPHPGDAEHPQMLTPLERELLTLVERLNIAFEQTSAQLKALEERSTGLLMQRLDSLEASLTASITCQMLSAEALTNWLSTPAPSTAAQEALIEALLDTMNEAQAALRHVMPGRGP